MKGIAARISTLAFCAATSSLLVTVPAFAQLSDNPNMSHFYMARQQIQILDDAPVIYDKRTNPAAAAQSQGALPRGPAPLPRAGFNSYSSSLPQGMGSSLPEVVNGVPKKIPPPAAPKGVNPNMAKAGKYKNAAAKKPAKPSGPVVTKTYAPYQGYGAPAGSAASSRPVASYGSNSSSTNVRGSLLHWSRTRSPNH